MRVSSQVNNIRLHSFKIKKKLAANYIIIKSSLLATVATKINASIIMEAYIIKILITCLAARVGLWRREKRRQEKRKRVGAKSLISDYFF